MEPMKLKMVALFKDGIFLPSIEILGVYKRYIFSCLEEILFLISGTDSVACNNLNMISSGMVILAVG